MAVKKEEITEKNKRIFGMIMLSLRINHNSPDKKIKSAKFIAKLAERGYKISDAELREIIGHIRRNDLLSPGFILSDNSGYWYSEDRNEMQHVWKSQYSRAVKIMKNFQPLHKRFIHLGNEENSIFNGIEL